MRSKEDAKDYRYFPDPDLPLIHISDAWIEEPRASIPELREARWNVIRKSTSFRLTMRGILTESDIWQDFLRRQQFFWETRKSSKLVYGGSSTPDKGQRS